jgi:hypothetical protein
MTLCLGTFLSRLFYSCTMVFFLRISNFFGLSITEEPLLVEMRIWCIKIGIILVLDCKRIIFDGYNDLQLPCANESFLQAKCCPMCFMPIIMPFLTHWSWLRFVLFSWSGNKAHGGWDRLAGDDYSSQEPDPTSNIPKGPCLSHSLICIS